MKTFASNRNGSAGFAASGDSANPRVHRCDICGKIGEWTKEWCWYGSLMDMDEGRHVIFCSGECRTEIKGNINDFMWANWRKKMGYSPND